MLIGVLGLSLLTGAIRGIPLSRGDLLTVLCAFAWAAQVVAVDRLSGSVDPPAWPSARRCRPSGSPCS